MNNLSLYNALIGIGLGAVILEIILGAATGFDLLLVGLIFVASGFIGQLFKSPELAIGLITIFSVVYIFFGRRFVKKQLTIETKTTNVDALIGQKGIVVKEIVPHKPGQIKIEGEIWRAESESHIVTGKQAKIISVRGITLQVEPIS